MKAMQMMKRVMAAATAAVCLSACGTAAVSAPSVAEAPAQLAPTAVAAAPKVVQAAAVRRLMEASTTAATLWGLDFRFSYHRVVETKYDRPGWYEMVRGRIFWHKSKTKERSVDYGWVTEMAFAGDGDLEDMTNARLLYTVPEGRVLIVNRVVNPERVSINGCNLGGIATDDVNFVFGPGESVLFGLPVSSNNSGSSRKYSDAKIYGFTADPAIFGGSLSPLSLETGK